MFVICPLAVGASAADEGADGQSPQAPAETDSLQWYQELMQRAAQRAEKDAAAADEKEQTSHPLGKGSLPRNRPIDPIRPMESAGADADIIETEAGGYEVVSRDPEVNEAKPAAAEPENRPFPTSDEINEMDRETRRFTMRGFISFLVIAAVVLMCAYVLPVVVGGRKPVASKVRIEKLGDWQETASPTPKEPDNP
jgi:hypothetical protein